jgi:hypothetical protein
MKRPVGTEGKRKVAKRKIPAETKDMGRNKRHAQK